MKTTSITRRHTLALLALPAALALSWPFAARAHGDGKANSHASMHGDMPISDEQHAWGKQGHPKQAKRTIAIRMTDKMRFEPNAITVKQGETVRLKVTNGGKTMHELVIGTPEVLAQHAEMMKKHPNMEHDEAFMAHVKPGKTGEIVWTFNQAGTFQFACLIAGHFEAGMVGTIQVNP